MRSSGLLFLHLLTLLFSADDDHSTSVKEDSGLVAEVGNVIVRVYRVNGGQKTTFEPNLAFEQANYSKVHEKALKGEEKSHGVT